MSIKPIVMVSSYPPRLCGIGTFTEEALIAQTLESEGGLLFTNKDMLKQKVIRLACDEKLRLGLGENLKQYLDDVVSWNVVCKLYNRAYDLAHEAKRKGSLVVLDTEF